MAAAIQDVKSKKSRTERIPINVSRPARFQVLSSTYAIRVCNYHAAMTVLNVGRLAGWDVEHVPKFHTMAHVRAPRNAPRVMGRNYRRIVESGESGEGERPGTHVAIAISARFFIYQVNSVANLFLFALCFSRITMSTPRTFPHLG